jgi:pyruvate, water dikinase
VSPTPLVAAKDLRLHGGKAVSLGAALRAGLPVPGGLALDIHLVDAIALGRPAKVRILAHLDGLLATSPVAVRSSAVGEDSAAASFAGQHTTRLNVAGCADVLDAVCEVHASARSSSALAYRQRMGIPGEPQIAVVVQTMIRPECAGVLFTRNPISGEDERVIEASWGLGEAVVSGLVTPDRWHMRRGGEVRAFIPGHKDIEIRSLPGGGTEEVDVPADRAARPCLEPGLLFELEQLAQACERQFCQPSDIEWAVEGGRLYLLQCRPVTSSSS